MPRFPMARPRSNNSNKTTREMILLSKTTRVFRDNTPIEQPEGYLDVLYLLFKICLVIWCFYYILSHIIPIN